MMGRGASSEHSGVGDASVPMLVGRLLGQERVVWALAQGTQGADSGCRYLWTGGKLRFKMPIREDESLHGGFLYSPHSWIKRTFHPLPASLQYMGIDHCGADILVAQKFLHGTNVIAIFQQTGRKTMA